MNLAQFYGKGFPLGAATTQLWCGDKITAADGSEWLASTPTAPFAYTSDYSYLPDSMLSPHPLMAGPNGGLWAPNASLPSIAYDPGTGKYCTSAWEGDSTNGYTYYTSSDGATWTKRTFPNSPINYEAIVFTAGKFFAWARATTTNGVIYSTDGGVTWTSKNFANNVDGLDAASDGANNIVIFGASTGVATQYSTDGGDTWTGASNSSAMNSASSGPNNQGWVTYNAGAGLFIAGANGNTVYNTSPTGATFTTRSTQATFAPYVSKLGNARKFASNATVTVCVGNMGFFCTTTDGLTWANHGYISSTLTTNVGPSILYWDGTRFVARFLHRVFYSTNGIAWTEGKYIGGGSIACPYSNGVYFVGLWTAGVQSKLLRVADVTLTPPQTVIANVLPVASGVSGQNYYRIR